MTNGNIVLKPGERIDRLGYQGLQIIQNPAVFKFTLDAFLLTGFIRPKPSETIVDLGTGSGVLPLLLAGQDRVSRVTGVEIQPELADMARRSVRLNRLENQITIIQGDLREIHRQLPVNGFHWVVTNPPYYPAGAGVVSENPALAMAKFEVACTLQDWVRAASRLVKGNGRVAAIYPTERLAELITVMIQHHLTPKRLCFVYSYPDAGSNLVLLEARPGGKPGLQVLPPLTIYTQPGQYSERMNQIFAGKKI